MEVRWLLWPDSLSRFVSASKSAVKQGRLTNLSFATRCTLRAEVSVGLPGTFPQNARKERHRDVSNVEHCLAKECKDEAHHSLPDYRRLSGASVGWDALRHGTAWHVCRCELWHAWT